MRAQVVVTLQLGTFRRVSPPSIRPVKTDTKEMIMDAKDGTSTCLVE